MTQPDRQDRKANRRGAARLAAVQALYQMDVAAKGLNEIFAEFESHWLGREVDGSQYLPAEAAFFREVVGGVVRDQLRLDPMIDAALSKGWPLRRIEALMRAVLRAGLYELDQRRDIPTRVIVSEYVDVAGAFVDKEETGMVNAVLDQLGRQVRTGEPEGRGGRPRDRARSAALRRGSPHRAVFSPARAPCRGDGPARRCRILHAARRAVISS